MYKASNLKNVLQLLCAPYFANTKLSGVAPTFMPCILDYIRFQALKPY